MEPSKFFFPPSLPEISWQFISQKQLLKIFQSTFTDSFSNFHSPLINSTKPSFFNDRMDHFFEKVTNATNENLKKQKKEGLIQKEVSLISSPEIKHFFAITAFMQDYHFPDYQLHFKLDNSLIKSPIGKIMSLSRFQLIATHLDLKKSDLMGFFDKISLQQTNSQGFLLLKAKKFGNLANSIRLFLLYDENGLLLKGVFVENMEENHVFEGISQLFVEIPQRFCVILPKELTSMKLALKLRSMGYRTLGILAEIKENPFIEEALMNELSQEVFIFNRENELIIARFYQDNKAFKKPLFLLLGSDGFYNKSLETPISVQVLDFIKEKKALLKKKWDFSIWKTFYEKWESDFFKPTFLLFKSLVFNWFLTDFSTFYTFLRFKETLFLSLTKKKQNFEEKTLKRPSFNENGSNYKEKGHFPEKMKNCKICRVCRKNQENKQKKTKYRCKACSEKYGKDITMCVDQCFRLYHKDREWYNQRKKPIRKKI